MLLATIATIATVASCVQRRRREPKSEEDFPSEMIAAAMPTASQAGVTFLKPEERLLSLSVIAAYLGRLGISTAPLAPTLATLEELQRAHCDLIAYENLDLHAGTAPLPQPTLGPHASARRVTTQHRGGYCFLIVDAYAALLCSLGFRVSMHTAGVGESPLPTAKWGNHIVLLVRLDDGRTVVSDVGLGDGPARPFELKSHAWDEDGYRFKLEERAGGLWHFTHDPLGSFSGFDFSVATTAESAREFEAYHAFYWNSLKSNYRTSGVVLQRVCRERGILCLRSCTLKRIHPSLPGGSAVLETAETQEQWLELVQREFHLPLSDLTAQQRTSLWAVVKAKHEEWRLRKDGERADVSGQSCALQ